MTTQVYKHQSIDGLSSTNIIYDKDVLAVALEGHDNADEILAVLGASIDREDNGFRNIKEDELKTEHGFSNVESSDRACQTDNPLHQLISDESGTSQILDHVQMYLGDNRAWRNGWNPKSYQRHAKATRKAQADNGLIWGKFSMIPTASEKAEKEERIAQAQASLEAKKAKRLAKMQARFMK